MTDVLSQSSLSPSLERGYDGQDPLRQAVALLRSCRAQPGPGRALFLIGAGCSASAGIPLGWEVAGIACCLVAAQQLPPRAADFSLDLSDLRANHDRFRAAKQALEEESLLPRGWDLGADYGRIFGKLEEYGLIQHEVIDIALDFGGDRINWAHACLGQLVKSGFIHTVMTTNFDQLVLDGMVRCGVIPVVADSLEMLNRIRGRPKRPQLVHLHGSRHAYALFNSSRDVLGTAGDHGMRATLDHLVQESRALFVIGYRGGEEGVMDLIEQALARLPNQHLVWVSFEPSQDRLSDRAKKLLGAGRNRRFLGGYDADRFFAEVMRDLGLGAPDWVRDPIGVLVERAGMIADPGNDPGAVIANRLRDYRGQLAQWGAPAAPVSAVEQGPVLPAHEDPVQLAIRQARDRLLAGDAQGAFDLLHSHAALVTDYGLWLQIGDTAREAAESRPGEELYRVAIASYAQGLRHAPEGSVEQAKLFGSRGKAAAGLWWRTGQSKNADQAEEDFSAAIDILRRLDDPVGAADRLATLSECLRDLGLLYFRRVGPGPARPLLKEALECDRHLQKITKSFAAQRSLSSSLERMGDLFLTIEGPAAAIPLYQESLYIRRALAGVQDTVESQHDLLWVLVRFSRALVSTKQSAAALPLSEESMEIGRALAQAVGTPESRRDLLAALSVVGDALAETKGPAAALPLYKEGLDISRTLAEASGSHESRRDLTVVLIRVGDATVTTEGPIAALPLYQEGVKNSRAIVRELGTPESRRDLSVALGRVGDMLARTEGIEMAHPYLEEALAEAEAYAAMVGNLPIAQNDVLYCRTMLENHSKQEPPSQPTKPTAPVAKGGGRRKKGASPDAEDKGP